MSHFYKPDGSTCYEIIGKNGKPRTPYKKEAKEMGLAPGVTSINGQLDKPNLVNWIVDRAINVCASYPYCEMGMNKLDWAKNIKNKIKEDQERITGQGHDIHDALEVYYKTGRIMPDYADYIVPVIELIEAKWPHLQRTDWVAEKSFCYKGLFGGKVDLHYPGRKAIDHLQNIVYWVETPIILDFKTKDTEDKAKFKAYDEHKQQLVAYSYGLDIIGAGCGNIFLSALKPGIIGLEMHKQDELQHSWEKFKILTQYWHLENFNSNIGNIL